MRFHELSPSPAPFHDLSPQPQLRPFFLRDIGRHLVNGLRSTEPPETKTLPRPGRDWTITPGVWRPGFANMPAPHN